MDRSGTWSTVLRLRQCISLLPSKVLATEVFNTRRGMLDLGPNNVRENDVLVILFDNQYPQGPGNEHIAAILQSVGHLGRLVQPGFVI
jgi:hypothetical protein